MKVDILAIGAHPDDIELGCGGTILKSIQQGYQVGIVDLTSGELGTRGSGPLRLEEAKNAQVFMNINHRRNLHLHDGFFEINATSLQLVIEQIRLFKPRIILCNATSDRHPDHGRAASLVERANFLAGLPKVESNWNGVPQKKWRATSVFHYIQDRYMKPDFVIDITDFMDDKIACIQCYSSQFYDPNSDQPETPLSGIDFFNFIRGQAKTFGRNIGVPYAEGFTVQRSLGVNNLGHIF